MSNANNIKKAIIYYTLGSLFTALVGFIFIPYYMREFSTFEYGVLSLIQLLGVISSAVFYFGISASLNRYYFDVDNSEEQNNCVYTAIVLSFIGVLLQVVFGYVISTFASNMLFSDVAWSWAVFLSLANAALIFYNQIFLILYRLKNKPSSFFLFSFLNLVFNVGFIYSFVVVNGRGVNGVFEGAAASQLLMATVLTWRNRELLFNGSFSTTLAKKQLRYGVHFIWSSIAALSILWIDQFFINKYLSIEDVGVYAVAAKFATVMTVLFVNPFSQVLQPVVMEAIKDDAKAREKIENGFKAYVIVGGVLSFLAPVFLEEVIYLFKPQQDYLQAIPYMFPLFFATTVYGMVNVVTLGFLLKNKLGPQSKVYLFLMVLNIVLNIALIPNLGVWGAVASTLITYSCSILVLGMFSNRVFYARYSYGSAIMAVLLYCLCVYFNTAFLSELDVIYRLALKFTLFLLLPSLVLYSSIKNNKLKVRG